MITIHDGFAEDFGGMGLGALSPVKCTVQEEAGGRYEAELVQPITPDGRHRLMCMHNVLRIPAPVREATGETVETTETVEIEIWQVRVNTRLRLRQGPSTSAKVLGSYRSGTQVSKLGEENGWMRVQLIEGGAVGWMSKTYLRYVRTDTIEEGGSVTEPATARDQLFRIVQVKRNTNERQRTVIAQHISYDLKGVIVASDYSPEGAPASEVCRELMARADHDAGFTLHCQLSTPVSGEYGGRNIMDCLLSEDDGVLKQTGGRLVRDNFDVYILPAQTTEPRLELRRGHNLLSAELNEDGGDIVTRIRPVGQKKNGDPLYLTENDGYVDSAHIDEYPVIYTKQISYNVTVGRDGVTSEAQARQKLGELARADFEENGFDQQRVSLSAKYVRLEQLAKYALLKKQYALYMYDAVRVWDGEAGIDMTLQMSAYTWDALNRRYDDTDLGELVSITDSGGYVIGSGGGGTRVLVQTGALADGAVSTDKLADGAVTKDKLKWTEIEAEIRRIIAEVTGN